MVKRELLQAPISTRSLLLALALIFSAFPPVVIDELSMLRPAPLPVHKILPPTATQRHPSCNSFPSLHHYISSLYWITPISIHACCHFPQRLLPSVPCSYCSIYSKCAIPLQKNSSEELPQRAVSSSVLPCSLPCIPTRRLASSHSTKTPPANVSNYFYITISQA